MQIKIDAARLRSELDTLATFTHAEPVTNGTAVTRIVFPMTTFERAGG